MKKQSILGLSLVLMVTLAAVFISCNKKFDSPPFITDPGIKATISLKELKARHSAGNYELINDSVIIGGVVVGNDKSGNIYKQIFIQDSTGGLAVVLDRANLYGDYPVGRQVYIKAKGLCLADYHGLIQLCVLNNRIPTNPSFDGIASLLLDSFIVKGTTGHEVVPKAVTVPQLTKAQLTAGIQNEYQSTLIRLDNYEVGASDTSITWADISASKNAGDIHVQSCAGASSLLVIRTSGFANFAGLKPPKGNGTLLGISTVYNSGQQLVIRDTSDVQFYGNRCPPPVTSFISIADLRNLYAGTDVTIDAKSIKGIVISDAAAGKNISAGNLVLQDGNSGIDLYFGTAAATKLATFAPGDSLVIDITGARLTSYNGMLELSMASSAVPAAATLTAANGAGKSVVPAVMTVKQASDNIALIENTMVTILNATASPAGTYSGNKTLTDASGNMLLRTVTTATFAGATLPATCQNWTGYVSRFLTDKQLYIRDPTTDLTAGTICSGGGGGGGTGITLGTSPKILNFDGISAPLPTGVSVRNSASATALGTELAPNTGLNFHWGSTSGGAKVFASATGLTETTDSATQSLTANRALGYRQTGSNGDPGAAFVFQLDNTTGKSNLALEFLLQSLDKTSTRTVTWAVDYGIGDAPATFTKATTTGTMTTGGSTWSNNTITVDFGGALDNQTGKVWIRIVALTGSTGSSNRPSTGIDDVKFTWN